MNEKNTFVIVQVVSCILCGKKLWNTQLRSTLHGTIKFFLFGVEEFSKLSIIFFLSNSIVVCLCIKK